MGNGYGRNSELLVNKKPDGSCLNYSFDPNVNIDSEFSTLEGRPGTKGWSTEGQKIKCRIGERKREVKFFDPFLGIWNERLSIDTALLKNDYDCLEPYVSATIKLDGMDMAGIIFGVRGTFDYNAAIVDKDGNLHVQQVLKGEVIHEEIIKARMNSEGYTRIEGDEIVQSIRGRSTNPNDENDFDEIIFEREEEEDGEYENQPWGGGIACHGDEDGIGVFKDLVMDKVNFAGPYKSESTKVKQVKTKIDTSELQKALNDFWPIYSHNKGSMRTVPKNS